MRLDVYLKNLNVTRNKALELIKNGFVEVDNKIILKPAFCVDSNNDIKILKNELFVSRAGQKLDFYLKNYFCVHDLSVLDIGSAKGGFCEALLKNGAKSVTCVDVGKNQFDLQLKNDARVNLFESCDIRDFKSDKKFDLIVCDVSFISLKNIIDCIYKFAICDAILLFKPQFEVGKNIKRDKKGVVMDKNAIKNSLDSFINIAISHGFRLENIEKSIIKGKAGNEEMFIHFKK